MRPLRFVAEGRLVTSGRQRATDKGMDGAPFFLWLSMALFCYLRHQLEHHVPVGEAAAPAVAALAQL